MQGVAFRIQAFVLFRHLIIVISGGPEQVLYTMGHDHEFWLRMPFNDPAVFGRFNDDVASADADAILVNLQGPALNPCTAFHTFSFGRHIYLLNIVFQSFGILSVNHEIC